VHVDKQRCLHCAKWFCDNLPLRWTTPVTWYSMYQIDYNNNWLKTHHYIIDICSDIGSRNGLMPSFLELRNKIPDFFPKHIYWIKINWYICLRFLPWFSDVMVVVPILSGGVGMLHIVCNYMYLYLLPQGSFSCSFYMDELSIYLLQSYMHDLGLCLCSNYSSWLYYREATKVQQIYSLSCLLILIALIVKS